MNYTDWSSKLEQVLKRTDKDTLYDYLCDYAKSHEELAMALIGEFWQTEKDDYKSMVQKCLMHPTKLGAKSHEAYDWTAVACDLAKMTLRHGCSLLDIVMLSMMRQSILSCVSS